nr:MAG TPA: hypothetical protein [Caudoviricetes sp.]
MHGCCLFFLISLPFGFPGGFFDTPGLAKHPGVFLYPAPPADTPPLKKAPGCAGKAQGASGLH